MSQPNDLVMPKLGLTMTEGTLSSWAVSPGSRVATGDLLFVVETEKIATDVHAPGDGEVVEILVQEGDTVPVGTPVARWTGASMAADMSSDDAEEDSETVPPREQTSNTSPATPPVPVDPAFSQPGEHAFTAARVVATPYARRLARERGVALQSVQGSGPNGRIKAADVRAASTANAASPESTIGAPDAGAHTPATAVQRTTAQRMVEAKQIAPHFYLSLEAEISKLVELRRQLNQDARRHKLTINDLVVTAVVRALEAKPEANRIWQDSGFVSLPTVDVGVAISTEQGLFAPVLRNLGGLPVDEIAAAGRSLARRARAQQLSKNDLEGGAVTVSNAGMHNVTHMTPIINPPQSAILGVGSIREVFRPNADGAPSLRREIGLTLACDHRVHDGISGLAFLNQIAAAIEEPISLLRPQYTRS